MGRDAGADIVVTDETVSREHADLIEGADGTFYWIDRASTNGSFRQQGGKWTKFSKAYVERDEPLRLGKYETTVAALLQRAAPVKRRHGAGAEPRDDSRPVGGGVERDSDGRIRRK